MMQFTTPNGKYHVISHGNGWAYEITCQTTGDSLWFQDDSATQFQSDTADLTNEDVIRAYFECLI
jgi:hypothetical protein